MSALNTTEYINGHLEIRREDRQRKDMRLEHLKRAKICFYSSVTCLNVNTEHEHLGQRHRENQSLFCRQHDDSVTIDVVYLYQRLLVEQFSHVMESPCEDTTTLWDNVINSLNLWPHPAIVGLKRTVLVQISCHFPRTNALIRTRPKCSLAQSRKIAQLCQWIKPSNII